MIAITRKVQFVTRNRCKRMTTDEQIEQAPVHAGRVPRIARLMALAIRFDQLLRDGEVQDLSQLAHLAHVTQPRMTQIMNLLHLAPDIQEEILHLPPVHAGDDPITERDLRQITAFSSWAKQRQFWSAKKLGSC